VTPPPLSLSLSLNAWWCKCKTTLHLFTESDAHDYASWRPLTHCTVQKMSWWKVARKFVARRLNDYSLFIRPALISIKTSPLPRCLWRAVNFGPIFGAQGLWAGRDLYQATPAVTCGLGFTCLIRRTAPFNRLLRLARGPFGMRRTYSNPDPHGSHSIKCKCKTKLHLLTEKTHEHLVYPVRIDPTPTLVSHKRRLNGAVVRMRPHKLSQQLWHNDHPSLLKGP
jgi:hypothetical protein